MKNITNIEKSLCTGCGACYNKCPFNAISMELDNEGFLYPQINNDKCMDCGLCLKTCHANNAINKNAKGKAYLAWVDYVMRLNSYSGGMFTALATTVIEKGGAVCGARYSEDFKHVYHAWATNEDELLPLKGIKSIQSDIGQTYREAKEFLDNGRIVLYTGYPCQIAGLYSYLEKEYSNLYTLDLVCKSQNSIIAYQSFLNEYCGGKELINFEFGSQSPLADEMSTAAHFSDGTVKRSVASDSRWIEGVNGIINRSACYGCQYACEERVADITLANASQIVKNNPKFNDGKKTSALLLNSEKGKELIELAKDKIKVFDQISFEQIKSNNEQLTAPLKSSPYRRFFFSHLHKGYHNALWYGKGMRFDAGIVGWWFASNYGSSLTYYALAKILQSTGRQPIFIHIPKLDNTPWDKDAEQTINFIQKRFKVAKYRDMQHIHEVNAFCDSFLVGSDQMWTPLATSLVGYTFFLDFVDLDKKKIAFSTSFGQDKFEANEEICNTASDFLKRFDAISVREHSGVDVCRDKFGIEAEQIIDPVFLCGEKTYDELIENVKIPLPKKYLLTYILDPTPEKEEATKRIARTEGLEIISVMSMRDYDKNAQNWHIGKIVPKPTTEEFLYYIKKCSYLVTDSHHGACMGIIYKRPYVAITNASRGITRFETVAKSLGLEDRVLYSPEQAFENKAIHKPIDYDKVVQKIEIEKKRALAWLEDAFAKKTEVASETVNTVKAKMLVLESHLRNTVNDYERRIQANNIKNVSNSVNNNNQLETSFDFIKIRYLATLLRDYGIKHVVLSPGGRDVPIIRMFEYNDKEFILHSVTDERSAAYYGLGLASQLNEPVACVCTSGTAASNYLPAVTEAYYTGIPLIVITADRNGMYLNHGEDQTIPQKDIYRDVVKMAISLPDNNGDGVEYQIKRDISSCILEATHNGHGPVHINVPIQNISIGEKEQRQRWKLLPRISQHLLRVGFNNGDTEMKKWLDALKRSPRILIVYGQNKMLSKEEKAYVDRFASKFNCAIVTDSISNYAGEYSLNPFNMLPQISQDEFNRDLAPDILITVGGKRLMNDPLTFKVRAGHGIRHWSVVPDGKVKDFYFKLTSVIEATQAQFFRWFSDNADNCKNDKRYFNAWKKKIDSHLVNRIDSFNSLYIQQSFFPALPKNSFLHLGVGQSFFFVRRHNIDPSVEVYCNMGTNGIDGCTSTFMGQCAASKDRLCFLIVGDLSFFYDMNSIWNKKLTRNMRVLMINNNGSGLLRNHGLRAVTSVHNTKAEGWVRSTGFEYMSANTKEEFEEKLKYFTSSKSDKALFFEVFCD